MTLQSISGSITPTIYVNKPRSHLTYVGRAYSKGSDPILTRNNYKNISVKRNVSDYIVFRRFWSAETNLFVRLAQMALDRPSPVKNDSLSWVRDKEYKWHNLHDILQHIQFVWICITNGLIFHIIYLKKNYISIQKETKHKQSTSFSWFLYWFIILITDPSFRHRWKTET